jgi:hypothetical protein
MQLKALGEATLTALKVGHDEKANNAPGQLDRVIYIGGLGRSGSTVLERLLAQIPGVCAVGELVHMWERGILHDERCGCGRAFSECEFWREVGQRAFGGWAEVDVTRIATLRKSLDRNRYIPLLAAPRLPPSTCDRLDQYVGYYRRLYSAVASVSECSIVVDSSKHPSLAFCLRRSPDIDLRVLHVVRDSRAVAFSWGRAVLRPDSAVSSYMATYSPVVAAKEWNIHNGAFALLGRLGVPVLRVRYEDLASSPVDALTKIADFSSLPLGCPPLSFLRRDGRSVYADLKASHTASGNPMRFETGPVRIDRDERWRTGMQIRHARTVTALTFPLLARYGYLGRAS